jgi:hypothetical protein
LAVQTEWAKLSRVTDADHKFLVDYLRDRDEACPACKYNLRNLTGVRCPECGEELQLRVSPVEPKQAAPIAGLIGLCMGLGLNAMLLIYAGIEMIGRGRPVRGFMVAFIIYNAVACVIHVAAVRIWLWKWRSIRRAKQRRWWVVLAWGLSIANVIGFSFAIR